MRNRPPVVFVGGDHAIPDLMDDLAAALSGKGCQVIRGSIRPPPAVTEYPPEQWPELFGGADVIVVTVRTKLPRSALEAAPNLRAIVFPTIGTESVELSDARDLGLAIGHGPTPENFTGMAEATVMLIASLFLDYAAKEKMTRQNLPRPRQKTMKARLVKGKTIGLIGMGRIARSVVERLAGWEARILAADPYVSQQDAPAGVTMVGLPELLRESDLVSVHVTMSGETRHLISARELATMKPSAYLVNTARGGAIDEEALVDALRNGRIAGAALDVFEREPLPPDSPLRNLDNVLLTSHIAGHVREMHQSFLNAAMENIGRVLRGEPPLYMRNPDILPAWNRRIGRLGKFALDASAAEAQP